jgi:hypothetical protein
LPGAEDKSLPVRPESADEKGISGEKPAFEKKSGWKWVGIYFGLMLALYLYFIFASLSSSPKFIYTQF